MDLRPWQVSNNGGGAPHWLPNGGELIYQEGVQLLAVSYTVNGDAFVADRPRVWIAALGGTRIVAPGDTFAAPTGWDLAPDGTRVLVVTPVQGADAAEPDHHIVFVENFFDELRRRVPLGK